MEENNYKCTGCGANLNLEDKFCQYCGTASHVYQEYVENDEQDDDSIFDDTYDSDTNDSDDVSLGDVLGNVLGGLAIGGIVGSRRRRRPAPRPPMHEPRRSHITHSRIGSMHIGRPDGMHGRPGGMDRPRGIDRPGMSRPGGIGGPRGGMGGGRPPRR